MKYMNIYLSCLVLILLGENKLIKDHLKKVMSEYGKVQHGDITVYGTDNININL